MDRMLIQGGTPLKGEIEISGAKNAALPILAATLLSSDAHRLKNVPLLGDITTIKRLLEKTGAVISEAGDEGCVIQTRSIENCEASYDWVKTMRATILVLGPLLARCGEARVSLPGGCAIGARPIQLHLDGLEKMGAEIRIEHGMIHARAAKLKGVPIYFETPTVTGTENLMMAAALAEGTTSLENAACEPEIVDLAHFLNRCGARIIGAGTDKIIINGVSSLSGGNYAVMPDRIEAGTFMLASAITRGDLLLKKCHPDDMGSIIEKLQATGSYVEAGKNTIRVIGKEIHAVDAKTLPYPGLPTDMQAQFMALMSVSDGLSVITETIFESRFNHCAELKRMGADIRVEGHHAVIKGVPRLSGAPVMASDLRASACLILAGLVAEGETEVRRIYHLDRGYEAIEQKLAQAGAVIRRVKGGF
ncbi:MAG: UDP-N-acetylglucosamine 1-carboxyvinyltransferase [Nitrospiria bacterium]